MRTNPNSEKAQNPSKIFAQWKDPGIFVYYDKEKAKNVELPSDFTFIVLGEFSTIKGWNDPSQSGIYSNEIRHIQTDILEVKAFKGGLIAKGTYGEISDQIKAAGGKFCSSVYVAYKSANGLELGNVQFTGASLSSWFDFRKEHKADIYVKAVKLVGKLEAKKGATKYFMPVFEVVEISKETDDKAGLLQDELKAYHSEYFSSIPLDVESQLDEEKTKIEQQVEVMERNFKDTVLESSGSDLPF